MTVIRFDPFGDPFRQLDRLTSQLPSGTCTPMGMAMDVWQADDGYHAVLDLPGVDASSVEITSERNVLTIAAERRPEYEQGQNVLIAERPQEGSPVSFNSGRTSTHRTWKRATPTVCCT